MRFKTITLGCKVNQYETELIRETFLANGWTEEPDFERVELAVINTCSVTAESDAKSRKLAASLAKKAPNARLAILGCFAATDPAGAAALPNVDYVVGDKRRLPEFFRRLGLAVLPEGIGSLGKRHRAYVKVQDGCRVGCAYCVIPSARPYLASRSADAVLREIERLAAAGYREIVLTGIHLGHYGLDLDAAVRGGSSNDLAGYLAARDATEKRDRHSLAKLLARILAERFPVRYRLGSLEAVETPDELIELVAENAGDVCPHFHLSLQSGSDAVLSRMKRRWPSGPFFDRCAAIRERIPFVALTTDLIVGFPGETEDDFLASCDAVTRIGFAKTHIFRFSPRPGTLAAAMSDPIPEPLKKERAVRLERTAEAARLAYARRLIGRRVETLLEEFRETDGRLQAGGTCAEYMPVRSARSEALAAEPGSLFSGTVEAVDSDGTLIV